MDESERFAKVEELELLRAQVQQLEGQLKRDAERPWQASGYYAAYYAIAGFVLGMFGAAASLLFNIIGATLFGRHPLELIRVYLTFPLGERALSLTPDNSESGLLLAVGCCLYLATGMILGVPFHLLMTRFVGQGGLVTRLVWATLFSILIWLVNFYAILNWVQPLLLGGNWIVEEIPIWVAILTHLSFGLTMGLLYPLGLYQPYRLQTEHA